MPVNPIPLPQQTWGDSTAKAISQERDRRFQERMNEARLNMQKYGIDVGADTSRYATDVGAATSKYSTDVGATVTREGYDLKQGMHDDNIDFQYGQLATQDKWKRWDRDHRSNVFDENVNRWNIQNTRAQSDHDYKVGQQEKKSKNEEALLRNAQDLYRHDQTVKDVNQQVSDWGDTWRPDERNTLNPLTWDLASLWGGEGASMWDLMSNKYTAPVIGSLIPGAGIGVGIPGYDNEIKEAMYDEIEDYNPNLEGVSDAATFNKIVNTIPIDQTTSDEDLYGQINWNK
jgi:hypothetical protein